MTTPAALRELADCPCGRPAVISAVDSAGRRSAHCDDEECYWSIVGFTDEDVIERWNRRSQLRTAASEGGPSEVVAYQWLRNGKPTGGWFDGVPSERQLQAQKQCTGVAEWTVKYAYSRPSEVARDAGTPAEQSLALQMLVAAGHVTQVKVDEALSIAKSMHPVGAEARDAGHDALWCKVASELLPPWQWNRVNDEAALRARAVGS